MAEANPQDLQSRKLREILRGYVDTNVSNVGTWLSDPNNKVYTTADGSPTMAGPYGAQVGVGQYTNKQYDEDLATAAKYFANNGAGDLLGVGKAAYERIKKAVLAANGGDEDKTNRILRSMQGMVNDGALQELNLQYGLRGPENFSNPQDYVNYLKENGFSDGSVTPAILNIFKSQGYQEEAAAAAAANPQPGDVNARAQIHQQIQDFYNRMSAPVTDAQGNITEPIVKQLATIGRNMGLQGASGHGIQGGAATLNGSNSAMANALPYLQQRASLAANANQLLQNGQLGYEASNQGLASLGMTATGMQNDVTQAGFINRTNQAQGIGSAIGGVVGTAAAAYFNQPQLAKVGTSLGGSVGTLAVQQPKYGTFNRPSGNGSGA